MKIEKLIKKLNMIAKSNPRIEVKVDTNSSWPAIRMVDPILMFVNDTKTNNKFLLISY